MEKAEDKLAQTFGTTTAMLLKLGIFYKMARGGVSTGTGQYIFKEADKLKNEMQHLRCLDDPGGKKFISALDELHLKMAEETQSVIDSAFIVFAHGILESCIYDYLAVTTMACPERWERFIKKKTVEFETVRSKSFEQIRKDKIGKLLNSVRRESLIDKLNRLHQIVPPTTEITFPYDSKKLVKFDKARHNIVHGNDWSSYPFNFDLESAYWFLLNNYFAKLICVNTGLKLSTEKASQYLLS